MKELSYDDRLTALADAEQIELSNINLTERAKDKHPERL